MRKLIAQVNRQLQDRLTHGDFRVQAYEYRINTGISHVRIDQR